METIKINVLVWNVEEFCGYKPITTFWEDFSIAEAFGINAIRDTFERAFSEWRENYKYLTELIMVLNHKIWQWYEKNKSLANLYNDIYNIADGYAIENLKDEELNYFYSVTD